MDARGTTHSWRIESLTTLMKLKGLPEETDSFSPHQPSPEMFERARAVLNKINRDLPQPMIAAASDGTIQIKWQKPGLETSFFVYSDGTLEFLTLRHQKREAGDLRLDDVDQRLADF
jgi:hypothetical protein